MEKPETQHRTIDSLVLQDKEEKSFTLPDSEKSGYVSINTRVPLVHKSRMTNSWADREIHVLYDLFIGSEDAGVESLNPVYLIECGGYTTELPFLKTDGGWILPNFTEETPLLLPLCALASIQIQIPEERQGPAFFRWMVAKFTIEEKIKFDDRIQFGGFVYNKLMMARVEDLENKSAPKK